MTDQPAEDRRHDGPILAPQPEQEEATGDHGPQGADIDALVADASNRAASGDPLMEDPGPRG